MSHHARVRQAEAFASWINNARSLEGGRSGVPHRCGSGSRARRAARAHRRLRRPVPTPKPSMCAGPDVCLPHGLDCRRGRLSACRGSGRPVGAFKPPPPNSSELSPDLGAGCSRILTYDELTTRPHAVVRLLRKRRGRCGVSRQRGGGRWPGSAAPKLQSIDVRSRKRPAAAGRGKVNSPVSSTKYGWI